MLRTIILAAVSAVTGATIAASSIGFAAVKPRREHRDTAAWALSIIAVLLSLGAIAIIALAARKASGR